MQQHKKTPTPPSPTSVNSSPTTTAPNPATKQPPSSYKPYLIILGLSSNPQRYSYKVDQLAHQQNIPALGVHPHYPTTQTPTGSTVLPTLSAAQSYLKENNSFPHTLSVYVRKEIALTLVEEIKDLAFYTAQYFAKNNASTATSAAPLRVILNPGADDPAVVAALHSLAQAKPPPLKVMTACTLVLLTTGQY